jgi:CRP-like cAMP-binding protein
MQVQENPTSMPGQWDCGDCRARNTGLCQILGATHLAELQQRVQRRRFLPPYVIFDEGTEGRYLYIIRHGLVKLTCSSGSEIGRMARPQRTGDVAGMEVLGEWPYRYTAHALMPVEACRIPVDFLRDWADRTEGAWRGLFHLSQRIARSADEWAMAMCQGSARVRVARLLLYLAQTDPKYNFELFPRKDLGAMLGVSMETASRIIAEFKRRRLIRKGSQGVLQADMRRLESIASLHEE